MHRQIAGLVVQRALGPLRDAVDFAAVAAADVEGPLAVHRLRPEEGLGRLLDRGDLQGAEGRRQDQLSACRHRRPFRLSLLEIVEGFERPEDRRDGEDGSGEGEKHQGIQQHGGA